MSYESAYQLSVRADWTHEQLLKVLSATAATGYLDVTLVLPAQVRALQTLDHIYSLRKTVRDLGLSLTFSGGNKTLRGLARLLGFRILGYYPQDTVLEAEQQVNPAFWTQPPPSETEVDQEYQRFSEKFNSFGGQETFADEPDKEKPSEQFFWQQPPPPQSDDTSLMLAIATIKALLISKGVFNEEEYQQMYDFVERQWQSRIP